MDENIVSNYERREKRRARRRKTRLAARIALAILAVALIIAVIFWLTYDPYKATPENDRLAVMNAKTAVFEKGKADSKVLGTLEFGTQIDPVAYHKGWYRMDYDGQEGYVQAKGLFKYDKDKKHIALTFDDGPKEGSTEKILDSLKANGARATFFVIGDNINKETGKLLAKGSKQGNEYGNHSKNHADLTKLKPEKIQKQMEAVDKKVEQYTGRKTTLCRVPYGDYNAKVLAAIGKPNIMWTVDTLDWEKRDTKRLVKIVKKEAGDGEIVLMHEIYGSTADGVDQICKDLADAGYETVTVTELAAIKGVKLETGKSYTEIK